MDEDDALFLWCWTMAFPEVMRDEAQVALQMFRGVTVSLPTISREWQRLGLSRGVMTWYSALRREPSRIAWWCNPPDPALNVKVSAIHLVASSAGTVLEASVRASPTSCYAENLDFYRDHYGLQITTSVIVINADQWFL